MSYTHTTASGLAFIIDSSGPEADVEIVKPGPIPPIGPSNANDVSVTVPQSELLAFAALQARELFKETIEEAPGEILVQLLASAALLLGEEEPLATLRRRLPPGSWVRFYDKDGRAPVIMRPAAHRSAAPPPRLSVREWVDAYRYLSPETPDELPPSAPWPGHYAETFDMLAPALFLLPQLEPASPPEAFDNVTRVEICSARPPNDRKFLQVVIDQGDGQAMRTLPAAFHGELVQAARESQEHGRLRARGEELVR